MDFVTFEIAKRLKEKGFDEECLAYYTSEYTLYNNKVVLCDDKYLNVSEIDYEDCLYSYNTQKDKSLSTIVDAPRVSQVLKWLREEKNIHICIGYSDNINAMWDYEVTLLDGALYQNSDFGYKSYEEAVLAGIEYVLDNLI